MLAVGEKRDARAMESLLIFKQVNTPKQAVIVIDKPVTEWTTRRALRSIGLISVVKQKKPTLSETNVKAHLNFCM